jgi:hypothetical protein
LPPNCQPKSCEAPFGGPHQYVGPRPPATPAWHGHRLSIVIATEACPSRSKVTLGGSRPVASPSSGYGGGREADHAKLGGGSNPDEHLGHAARLDRVSVDPREKQGGGAGWRPEGASRSGPCVARWLCKTSIRDSDRFMRWRPRLVLGDLSRSPSFVCSSDRPTVRTRRSRSISDHRSSRRLFPVSLKMQYELVRWGELSAICFGSAIRVPREACNKILPGEAA